MNDQTAASDDLRRRSEWDVASGAGNYGVLVAGQAVGASLALGAAWLAAGMLGSGGYGGIAALIAASQLTSTFAIQWTAIALYRNGCEEFVATGRIATSFWNRLGLVAAGLVPLLLTARFWLPVLGRHLEIPASVLPLVLVHVATTAVATHVQQSLLAAKLPRLQSVLSIAERAALVGLLATLKWAHQGDWSHVALTFVLVPLVPCTLGLYRLRALVLPPVRPDMANATRILRFSLPLAMQAVVGYLTTNYLDAFFILAFLTAGDLGVYTLAYQVAGQFMQLPSLSGSLFLAFVVTSDTTREGHRAERFFKDVLPTLTLLWSVGATLLAFGTAHLLERFFDASFHASGALIWPLLAAVALASPVLAGLGPAAHARSRTSIHAAAAGMAALVNVALNAILVPRYGLMGCAWATTASFAAAVLTFRVLVPRLLGISTSWTLSASLPALVAAVVASRSGHAAALGAGVGTATLVGVVHRHSLGAAARLLPLRGPLATLALARERLSARGDWS